MNKLPNITKHIFFFCFCSISLTASICLGQEELTGLFSNPALRKQSPSFSKRITTLPLELPFFDDFSTTTGYPNQDLWSDSTHISTNTCRYTA